MTLQISWKFGDADNI